MWTSTVGEGEFVVVTGPSGEEHPLRLSERAHSTLLRGRMEVEVQVQNRSTREVKAGKFVREAGFAFRGS